MSLTDTVEIPAVLTTTVEMPAICAADTVEICAVTDTVEIHVVVPPVQATDPEHWAFVAARAALSGN